MTRRGLQRIIIPQYPVQLLDPGRADRRNQQRLDLRPILHGENLGERATDTRVDVKAVIEDRLHGVVSVSLEIDVIFFRPRVEIKRAHLGESGDDLLDLAELRLWRPLLGPGLFAWSARAVVLEGLLRGGRDVLRFPWPSLPLGDHPLEQDLLIVASQLGEGVDHLDGQPPILDRGDDARVAGKKCHVALVVCLGAPEGIVDHLRDRDSSADRQLRRLCTLERAHVDPDILAPDQGQHVLVGPLHHLDLDQDRFTPCLDEALVGLASGLDPLATYHHLIRELAVDLGATPYLDRRSHAERHDRADEPLRCGCAVPDLLTEDVTCVRDDHQSVRIEPVEIATALCACDCCHGPRRRAQRSKCSNLGPDFVMRDIAPSVQARKYTTRNREYQRRAPVSWRCEFHQSHTHAHHPALSGLPRGRRGRGRA